MRLGRPPKDPSERKSTFVKARVTEAELARLRQAAREACLSLSEFLLRKALEAA